MSTMSKLLLSIFCLSAFISCQDKYTETYMANVPVYISVEEWRANEPSIEGPEDLNDPGKIYVYNDYLFIVDRGSGIHIFNNASPASPQNLGFIQLVGCADVAVRNDVLYVDSYLDLLSFDITNPASPQFICRIENAIESNAMATRSGLDESLPIVNANGEEGVIVAWEQKEITQDAEAFTVWQLDNEASSFTSPSGGVGIGGSMAQFAIDANHLYVLRSSSITSFDLSGQECPEIGSEVSINWVGETIFPYDDHLFIGTTSGMMIYGLSNPTSPDFVGSVSHLTACDPVVVQDDRAYVTVRTGNGCFGQINQLHVVDISDYSSPFTIAEYELVNPHGLGIDGNTLFICDGEAGLKVYDAEDDMTIDENRIEHYQDIDTYDVIPLNNILIMSAEEGIYQYDYSDPSNIVEMSFLPATP